jgi:hypothetical protein
MEAAQLSLTFTMPPPPAQDTPAPLWTSFRINPESRYADDAQDAATLAEICAVELKMYLTALRVFEEAERAGRNPLRRRAEAFTDKQRKQLQEYITEARQMADWMRAECADAFGEEDAATLYEYARRCAEEATSEEGTREAEQSAFSF